MPNRLSGELSPYLLQHASDPVDWFPWGEEAFRCARAEDKPIFLSIGYLSCHWCHVMARESFRDGEIAALLNESFIPVKVDREERPDLDSVYMEACRALTGGGGGWPMTLFLTPEGRPFYGGAYFPPRSRRGSIGLRELLEAVRDRWREDRASLTEHAEKLTEALRKSAAELPPHEGDDALIQGALWQLLCAYDEAYGGFGEGPKFPMPHLLLFLMQQYEKRGDGRLLAMAEKTLGAMAAGGIFDQIGGGFCRYAVDRAWQVPHFEKMLCDNALLIRAYVRAFRLTGNGEWLDTAKGTGDFVLRELTGPEGGFYSALDADSQGEEGGFYLLTPGDLRALLGEKDGEALCEALGVTGNGSFGGRSIPRRRGPLPPELRELLPAVREWRASRCPPAADDKVLCGWNGLMIEALCELYRACGEARYLAAAKRSQAFLDARLREGTQLFVSFRAGKRGVRAGLGDYASEISALLALWASTLEAHYLETAEALADRGVRSFFDEENGGFFLYDRESEQLFLRPKESEDGALPGGNSLMLRALLALQALRPSEAREEILAKQLGWQAARARLDPMGHAAFLTALSDRLEPPPKVTAAVGNPADLEALPFILPPEAALVILDPPTAEYPLLEGKTTYYVCRGNTCLPPVTELR
jgi:uncharacterized protein YyaL (SSP411 family)